jgi:hypothetical protein
VPKPLARRLPSQKIRPESLIDGRAFSDRAARRSKPSSECQMLAAGCGTRLHPAAASTHRARPAQLARRQTLGGGQLYIAGKVVRTGQLFFLDFLTDSNYKRRSVRAAPTPEQLTRWRLARHATQPEARTGDARCAARPVNLYDLSRVLKGRKRRYHAECADAHDIPRIANVHIATGEVIQDPALPLTVCLAWALLPAKRAELHTGDKG